MMLVGRPMFNNYSEYFDYLPELKDKLFNFKEKFTTAANNILLKAKILFVKKKNLTQKG